MYKNWASFENGAQAPSGYQSVLSKLPADDAKRVVISVVKTVASQLGLASPNQIKPSTLTRDAEVAWFMEVIGYGLALPFSDHDTIKDCVNIYCEWLSALLPDSKACVPPPIVQDPNLYARKIVQHLYHLFVPRLGDGSEMIVRQASLCHRVLRRIQDIVKQSSIMATETWESFLGFLLAINDALLSPPAVKDDVGDQLCERVLGVLYEIWLVACVKSFPSPSLWKTLREQCMNWRHRSGLIDQWNRVNLSLLSRMLPFMLGPKFPQLRVDELSTSLVPAEMSYETVAQSWYRFMHSIGNPVDLSRPEIISQTQAFYQYAIVAKNVIDPTHHPCLESLPEIFLKAMQSVSSMVDAFIGISNESKSNQRISRSDSTQDNFPPQGNSKVNNRPNVNSILHLFGGWLFEAAFIGNEDLISNNNKPMPDGSDTKSEKSIEVPPNLTPGKFELGKAEALGALCRIFCHKKTDEEISPLYLARFYLALQKGLIVHKNILSNGISHIKSLFNMMADFYEYTHYRMKGCSRIPDLGKLTDILGMIFVNSQDLFRCNLEGVNIVLPQFVTALELILCDKEIRSQLSSVSSVEVRRSAIQILLSILPLPLQFKNMKKIDGNPMTVDFELLWGRIHKLLINALQVENDAVNTQILLGGLMLNIQEAGQNEEIMSRTEFVSASHLVCHRLISSWKTDLNSSLAALELLQGLARTKLLEKESLECKRSLKWICDFIIAQCSRPPPAHSKDLHSSIVAAFHCCKTWLLHHPYLLQDKECISTVLEVIEFGISGSKSQSRPNDPPIMKEQKIAQPASRRVRDAAEGLLSSLMEQVDFYTVYCGAESLSSTIDEIAFVYLASGEMLTMLQAAQNFRYFVLDNNVLLGIYEDVSQMGYEQQAKVSVILRGMSGRSAWTMQLRHLPRHKSGQKATDSNPGRPLPMDDQISKKSFKTSFFPESIDKIPLCKADKSIPAVESVAFDERSMHELDELSHMMEEQAHLEQSSNDLTNFSNNSENSELEIIAPEPCQEYQAARLVLSHLGLLRLFEPKIQTGSDGNNVNVPAMAPLTTDNVDFINDLEKLDRQSTRTAETVYIFYMRNGQKHAEEIIRNVNNAELVNPSFLDFLASLGWPVNVWHHTGWTGKMSTSWRSLHEPMIAPTLVNHGGATFNGDHHILYWADSESEIAFIVPTKKGQGVDQVDENNVKGHPENPPRLARQQSVVTLNEIKITVVWVENFEDVANFPAEELIFDAAEPSSTFSMKDVVLVFVHVMTNGLLKVKLVGHQGKLVLPLINDMVIPKKCLGPLVRQTVVNLADRRRFDCDAYQPPLVKRRHLIQEIRYKYKSNLSEADLFTDLFSEN